MRWFKRKKVEDEVLGVVNKEREETTRIGFPSNRNIHRADITTLRTIVTRGRKRVLRKKLRYDQQRFIVEMLITMKQGNEYKIRWLSYPGSKEKAINDCIEVVSKRIRQQESPHEYFVTNPTR